MDVRGVDAAHHAHRHAVPRRVHRKRRVRLEAPPVVQLKSPLVVDGRCHIQREVRQARRVAGAWV